MFQTSCLFSFSISKRGEVRGAHGRSRRRQEMTEQGGREAVVFNIRPLKLAAKSAPATLQPRTDPRVRACASPRQRVGARFTQPRSATPPTARYKRDKVGGEDESANSNGKFEQRRSTPPSSPLPSIPGAHGRRHTPNAAQLKSCFLPFYCRPYYHQLGE